MLHQRLVVPDEAVQLRRQTESGHGRRQLRALIYRVLRLHFVDVHIQQDLAAPREQLGYLIVECLHPARGRTHRQRVVRFMHGGLLRFEKISRDVAYVAQLGRRQARQVHRFQREPLVFGAVFLAVEREQRARRVERHGKGPGREQERVLSLAKVHVVRVEVDPLATDRAVKSRDDAVGAQHLPHQLAFAEHQVKGMGACRRLKLYHGSRVVIDPAKHGFRLRLRVLEIALVLQHQGIAAVRGSGLLHTLARGRRVALQPRLERLLHQLGRQIVAGDRRGRIVVAVAGVERRGLRKRFHSFREMVCGNSFGALDKQPLRAVAVMVAHVLRPAWLLV